MVFRYHPRPQTVLDGQQPTVKGKKEKERKEMFGIKTPALAQQMNADGKMEWVYIHTNNEPTQVETVEQLVKLAVRYTDGLKKGWHIDTIDIDGDIFTLNVKKVE